MSLDYPNRADWLKIRELPHRKRAPRYLHRSTTFVHEMNPDGTKTIRAAKGRTYMVGRNAEKRAHRARWGR